MSLKYNKHASQLNFTFTCITSFLAFLSLLASCLTVVHGEQHLEIHLERERDLRMNGLKADVGYLSANHVILFIKTAKFVNLFVSLKTTQVSIYRNKIKVQDSEIKMFFYECFFFLFHLYLLLTYS